MRAATLVAYDDKMWQNFVSVYMQPHASSFLIVWKGKKKLPIEGRGARRMQFINTETYSFWFDLWETQKGSYQLTFFTI